MRERKVERPRRKTSACVYFLHLQGPRADGQSGDQDLGDKSLWTGRSTRYNTYRGTHTALRSTKKQANGQRIFGLCIRKLREHVYFHSAFLSSGILFISCRILFYPLCLLKNKVSFRNMLLKETASSHCQCYGARLGSITLAPPEDPSSRLIHYC